MKGKYLVTLDCKNHASSKCQILKTTLFTVPLIGRPTRF